MNGVLIYAAKDMLVFGTHLCFPCREVESGTFFKFSNLLLKIFARNKRGCTEVNEHAKKEKHYNEKKTIKTSKPLSIIKPNVWQE